MSQHKMVRAIYHDGALQLLEPVDLSDGIELQILLPVSETGQLAIQRSRFPTRPQPPETLCQVRGLLAAGRGMPCAMPKPCTMLVVIDTSVLIGVVDACDVWHAAARRLHDALLAERLPLVYVIVCWRKPAVRWPAGCGSKGVPRICPGSSSASGQNSRQSS